ncbi:MAG: hypothetical protein N3A62_10265 [Thermodesulfovibrionales bacterium]|nr:hypothetical protein [Thermodesulfovibrionales bacterium]
MAVENVRNNNSNVVQEMLARTQNTQNKQNMQQNQQMQQVQQQQQQQQNQQPEDRVTLNSRQNTQGSNNPAMNVPGESQRPRGANTVDNMQQNNNNIVAQLISEAANRTSNAQQSNNPYNPNKPTQTQNQINYTV